MDADEKILCKIECEGRHTRKSDTVIVTDARIYKTGATSFGVAHRKAVNVRAVTSAEWRDERLLRFPVIGLLFLALCCVLAAYFLPGGKTVRFVSGIVCIAVGVASAVACVVVYFRCRIRTLIVTYAGGTLRIASQGITEEEAEAFVEQVLRAAVGESARP